MVECLPNPVAGPSGQGKRLLVLGCGNPLAGDDSAGVEVVRRLSSSGTYDCNFVLAPFPDVELLDVMCGAQMVLVVDAVASGAPPGTLHLISWSAESVEPRLLGSLSSHGWGLAETLKLAGALGRSLPPVMILGIEIGELRLGAPRSAAVEVAVSRVVERFPALYSLLRNLQASLWNQARSFPPETFSFPGG